MTHVGWGLPGSQALREPRKVFPSLQSCQSHAGSPWHLGTMQGGPLIHSFHGELKAALPHLTTLQRFSERFSPSSSGIWREQSQLGQGLGQPFSGPGEAVATPCSAQGSLPLRCAGIRLGSALFSLPVSLRPWVQI